MSTVDMLKVPSKRGVRKGYHNLEVDVWKWALEESKTAGKLPTKASTQRYAQQRYSEAGHNDFKASNGWYRRWIKRYKLRESFSTARTLTATVETSISKEESVVPASPLHQAAGDGTAALESFSIETDELMINIEKANSPSQIFDSAMEMTDNGESSAVDATENSESSAMDKTETGEASMEEFMIKIVNKLDVDEPNGSSGLLSKKSCKYDKDFKDKVIAFIKQHRLMEAAAQFKISADTISIWMKETKFQDQLTQVLVKELNSQNCDRDIKNKEKKFCEWLREKEKHGAMVSEEEVREKLSSFVTPAWCGKTHWFAKYCYKFLHGKQSSPPTKINYSCQFRKLMVNYAARTSQIRTASVFNLARKQIFNWMKNVDDADTNDKKQTVDKLYEWYNSKSLKPAGRMVREKAKELLDGNVIRENEYNRYYRWCAENNIPVKRNCDEQIVEWILAAYDRNVSVSHEDVQKKALEIYRSQYEGSFKASTGWLLRFFRRYMNLLRRTPPLNATLPSACESNVERVRNEILHCLTKNNINGDVYGVMDEILLKLKPGTNSSQQQKPLLRSCSTNNVQGTVVLACLSNGVILPPLLVLKDKYDVTNDPNRFIIMYHQPSGTVDENVMEFWLENVWFKYLGKPNLLLADCFEPHSSERVRRKFVERNSRLIIIPAGCSSKLNPLTQTFSPQFQEYIDKYCCKWFEENSLTWQMGDSGTSLSSEDIIDWVEKAYVSVNTVTIQENVRNIFEQMGIVVKECGTLATQLR